MSHYAEQLTDPAEIELWNSILRHQGETFTTSRDLHLYHSWCRDVHKSKREVNNQDKRYTHLPTVELLSLVW